MVLVFAWLNYNALLARSAAGLFLFLVASPNALLVLLTTIPFPKSYP